MITVASLFDGIGGAPLCAVMCGAEPVWASEIEKFPIKVTEHRFPNMKHYGDITKINGNEVEPVDIIVGGSPCQDLSIAGKRAGLEGQRSGLFMEQIRIVKEMRIGTDKPRYMVWENVPGVFSSNGGEDFRVVLEEIARVADPTVSIPRSTDGWSTSGSILGEGFSVSWRTIDAQYFGVPQRRRRIYLVADFGGQTAPEILFEREGVSWNPSEGGTKGKGTAKEINERVDGAICIQGSMIGREEKNGPQGDGVNIDKCFTVNATDRHAVVEADESVIGFDAYQHHGWRENSTFGPLTTAMNTVRGDTPLVGMTRIDLASGQAVALYMREGCDGGGKRPLIQNERTGALTGMKPTLFEPRTQDGVCRIHYTGIVPSLNTAQGGQRQPCVAYDFQAYGAYGNGEKSNTITSHAGHEGSALVEQNKTVRRLTPLECERLQGFPDGWTNIEGASDSNRYKALGNSFAIPCALFVIQGCIEKSEAK